MSACVSCGAEVRWARTEANGRSIQVDPEPRPGGNLVVVGTTTGRRGEAVAVVRYVRPDPEVARHVAHFATCPHAERHRRTR